MCGINHLTFCLACRKPLEIKKTGVTVRYNNSYGHYRADLAGCPRCGYLFLIGHSERDEDGHTVQCDYNIIE